VTCCVAGVALYFCLGALGVSTEIASVAGMAAIALIRLAAIRWTITLPVVRMPER